MKQLTVEVTQEDIDNARSACSRFLPRRCFCPIALAIKRAVNAQENKIPVSVKTRNICVGGEVFAHTSASRLFIELFDNRGVAVPQTFVFEVTE